MTDKMLAQLDDINSTQSSAMLSRATNGDQKLTEEEEEKALKSPSANNDEKKRELNYVFRVINFETGAIKEEIVSQSLVKVEPLSLEGNGYRQHCSTVSTHDQSSPNHPAGDCPNKSHPQSTGPCTKENGKMNKKVQFKEAVYVCYETA